LWAVRRTGLQAMNLITLYPPEVGTHEVTFRWRVAPPTALYRKPQFTLRFPREVDLARVSPGLWPTIALICLHSHWPLLRPCRVTLPFSLRPGHAETWLRLTDAYVATLEAYRGTERLEREVAIQDEGPPLDHS